MTDAQFNRWRKGRIGDIWEYVLEYLPEPLQVEAHSKGFHIIKVPHPTNRAMVRYKISIPDGSVELCKRVAELQEAFFRKFAQK